MRPYGPQPVPPGVRISKIPTSAGWVSAASVSAASVSAASAGHSPHATRVLIIPGFTGSKEDFVAFLPRLADAGIQALSYSQRGQADSSAPIGVDNYRLEEFASDAIEIAEHWGASPERPIHLMGHSFGGVVARAAALARPDLFSTLTLFSSGAKAIPHGRIPGLDLAASANLSGAEVRRAVFSDLPTTPQEDLREELTRIRATDTSADNLLGIVRILATYPDRSAELAATHLPIHVIYGSDDPVWPTEWFQPEAAALYARHSIIDSAGHTANLEKPAELAQALVAFWLDHDSPAPAIPPQNVSRSTFSSSGPPMALVGAR